MVRGAHVAQGIAQQMQGRRRERGTSADASRASRALRSRPWRASRSPLRQGSGSASLATASSSLPVGRPLCCHCAGACSTRNPGPEPAPGECSARGCARPLPQPARPPCRCRSPRKARAYATASSSPLKISSVIVRLPCSARRHAPDPPVCFSRAGSWRPGWL